MASVFVADAVAHLAGLQEAGWALITAAIVTSNSVTGTWAAGRDQIIGTLIGAIAGTAAIELSLLGLPKLPVFSALLVPLAVLAAAQPKMRLTCVTLVVVFLFPSPGNPFERPLARIAAILIGAFSSLVVCLLVFRSRARASAFSAASDMLATLQQLLREAMAASMPHHQPAATRDALTEATTTALRALADAVIEARREHLSSLEQADPLLVRLVPMMRRLQSDVLFVMRAIDELADASSQAHSLHPSAEALDRVFDGLRRGCAAAARSEEQVRLADEAAAAIGALDQALACLGDAAGVPLRFTLQMLRRDLDDVQTAITQSAPDGAPEPSPAAASGPDHAAKAVRQRSGANG